jgi:DtxR family Mn-dependent transcriptional regulator
MMVKQKMVKKYSASIEDYLEAIANLHKGEKAVKVKQLSRMLNVKMPSVTAALQKLSEEGLVVHEKYGDIKLTPEGDGAAQDVIRRHRALSRFFADGLSIDRGTAEEDACKIEHVISPVTLERIIKFIEFIEACPLEEPNFPKRYRYYVEHGELPPECLEKGSGEK